MLTYRELARTRDRGRTPLLARLRHDRGRPGQNRGTIGGNDCVADPTNHFPPILTAIGARSTILSADGERTVDADEFFVGVYWTAVGEGELLTRISVPLAAPGSGDAFEGITLGPNGTYIVNAAATVAHGDVRIALGCVSAVPERAHAVEEQLRGPSSHPRPSPRRWRVSASTIDPPSDVHASADYRRALVEVCARRAVLAAAERAKG